MQRERRAVLDLGQQVGGESAFVSVGVRIAGKDAIKIGLKISLAGFESFLVGDDQLDRSLDGRFLSKQSFDRQRATGLIAVNPADDRDLGSPLTELVDLHCRSHATGLFYLPDIRKPTVGGLLQFLGVRVVSRVRSRTLAVNGELPTLNERWFALGRVDRRSDIVDSDAVEIIWNTVEILVCGSKQRSHPVVILEVDVFVDTGGNLYHPVEERAFGGAAAVVVPLILETV